MKQSQPGRNPLSRVLLEDPVVAVLLGMLTVGNWYALLGLLFFSAYILFAAGAGMSHASIKGLTAARRSFFDRPDDLCLHPIRLESVVSGEWLERFNVRRPSFDRLLFRGTFALPVAPVRAFWVEVLNFPAPTEWRAYPGSLTTQFIFALEPPSQMSAFNRFRMLHELHHVSVAGVGASWQKYVLPLLAPVSALGVLAILRADPSWPERWARVLVILVFWLSWEFIFAGAIATVMSEVRADEFAIGHLRHRDRIEVFDRCVSLWRSAARQKAASRLQRIERQLRIAAMTLAITVADAGGSFAAGLILGNVVFASAMPGHSSTLTRSLFRHARWGIVGLVALRCATFTFGPAFNIWFFMLGRTLHPQSMSYLLLPVTGAVFGFIRVGVLLTRATKLFESLQLLLVARGLA